MIEPKYVRYLPTLKGVMRAIVDAVLLLVGLVLLVPPVPSNAGQTFTLFPRVIPSLLVLSLWLGWSMWLKREAWFGAMLKLAALVLFAVFLNERMRFH